MKTPSGYLILVCLLAVLPLHCQGKLAPMQPLHAAAQEYDIYVLAMSWAPGVCYLKNCNKDFPRKSTNFNLHGLWPSFADPSKLSPSDCKNSPFKLSDLPKDLQEEANKYWNGLYGSSEGFIRHEWLKHGTCWNPTRSTLSKVPQDLQSLVQTSINDYKYKPAQTSTNYIRMAIALAKKYNFYDTLASVSIRPDFNKGVKKRQFEILLETEFNVKNMGISCELDKDGYGILQEIRLCLDLNYSPVDCPKDVNACPADIYYIPWQSGK